MSSMSFKVFQRFSISSIPMNINDIQQDEMSYKQGVSKGFNGIPGF